VKRGATERVSRWTVGGLEDSRPPLSAPLASELTKIRTEDSPRRESPAPMLDPSWTPAAGYSHASAILEALARSDADSASRKEGQS
jgi:hypothetical protein